MRSTNLLTYLLTYFGVCLRQSVNVADTVRDCLEKEPRDRTEDDIDTILNAVQHLQVS